MSAIKQPHTKGFTLVELMMALAVMTVLLVVAVPSLRDAVRRHRVAAASNALLADLAYARSEAIFSASVASICPSSRDRKKCDPANAYEHGWLVHLGLAGANGSIPSIRPLGLPLRVGSSRDGVAISAQERNLSFDAQGQLHASIKKPPRFTVCFRSPGSGVGTSTGAVPGVELTVNASGRVASRKMRAEEACL